VDNANASFRQCFRRKLFWKWLCCGSLDLSCRAVRSNGPLGSGGKSLGPVILPFFSGTQLLGAGAARRSSKLRIVLVLREVEALRADNRVVASERLCKTSGRILWPI
jgi:hypothetical protein